MERVWVLALILAFAHASESPKSDDVVYQKIPGSNAVTHIQYGAVGVPTKQARDGVQTKALGRSDRPARVMHTLNTRKEGEWLVAFTDENLATTTLRDLGFAVQERRGHFLLVTDQGHSASTEERLQALRTVGEVHDVHYLYNEAK